VRVSAGGRRQPSAAVARVSGGAGGARTGAAPAAAGAAPVAEGAAAGEGGGDAGQTHGRLPVLLPQHGAPARHRLRGTKVSSAPVSPQQLYIYIYIWGLVPRLTCWVIKSSQVKSILLVLHLITVTVSKGFTDRMIMGHVIMTPP